MSYETSRRNFILGAGAAASLLLVPVAGASGAEADAYTQLIDRRRTFITGGQAAATHPALAAKRASIDGTVSTLRETLVKDPARTALWANLPLDKLGSLAAHTDNMGVTFNQITSLALAWASAGSIHHQDTALLADINGALKFMAEKYKSTTKKTGNWCFWEIGAPRQVADALVLLGEKAVKSDADALIAAVKYFAPDPNRRTGSATLRETGANRSGKALACIARGLLSKNPEDIVLGRDALSDVAGNGKNSLFTLVTGGDGFYSDGSFVQHGNLPYGGTYGGVALSGVGDCMAMLAGSEWALSDPNVSIFLDAIDKSFAPFQWNARTMDTTRGRAVSRQAQADFDSGFAIIGAILVLAESAPKAQSEHFKSLVKGWLARTNDKSVAASAQSLASSARSLSVLEDSAVPTLGPRMGITNTYNQERVVHHRGTWAAVANTSSKRIGRYEWGNKENNLGWYQGDGMFFLYHDADPGQFSADFWPTVDNYALPGITANSEPRANGAAAGTGIPRAENSYAGGLTLGGVVGTTAMDLQNSTKKLVAKKSWFYLKDSVVCVGSGITDTSGTEVRTVVENRSFPAGKLPQVKLDGVTAGLSETGVPASVVHVDGHAGFLSLPIAGEPARKLSVRSEARTGAWQTINSGGDTGGTDEVKKRDYVRIEQLHTQAGDAYAYQILPQATATVTDAAAKKPAVEVLIAEDLCHLIQSSELSMGHFFGAGTWGGYTVSGACSVGMRRAEAPASGAKAGSTAVVFAAPGAFVTEIVVSQPSKTGETVTVTFPFNAPGTLLNSDPDVTVVSSQPLTLQVNMTALRGSEKRITFASLATAEPVTVRYVDDAGTEVAPSVTLTGELGQSYESVAATVAGFTLVTTPDNAKGVIGSEAITVTYVYAADATTSSPSPSASESGGTGGTSAPSTEGPSTAASGAPSSDAGNGGSDEGSLPNTGADVGTLGLGGRRRAGGRCSGGCRKPAKRETRRAFILQ